ncbi:type II secretion system protein [Castellaniella sp.]|uniref:type II secretion system protein n=1 Tax=Castellaniella sp. TaxID=1955812 RepID=UPI003A8D056E
MKTTRIKKEAFTLIETLIVLGIMVLVSIGIMTQLKSSAEKTRAKNAGEKIVEVGNALQSYVSDNKAALLSKIPVGTTQTLDDICVLNSAPGCVSGGLPMAEILPKSFTNNSLLDTGYKISLKNVDNKSIDGLVYTDSAVTLAGATEKPRYDLLGYATKAAGNAVGFSNAEGDQIDGLNGGWSIKNADLPYGGGAGVLAYRTNGIDDYDGTYLRRDGSNSMTGDLLLGNNNIKNVNSLTADNYVASQNAYFQTLRTQAIYNAGDIYTDSLNAVTVFAGAVNTNVVNATNPNKDTIFGSADKNTANGNLYSGNLTANQNVTASGTVKGGVFQTSDGRTTIVNGNISTADDNWALVARNGAGQDNAQQQNGIGSLYVNDIYLRSVGKWASQNNGGSVVAGGTCLTYRSSSWDQKNMGYGGAYCNGAGWNTLICPAGTYKITTFAISNQGQGGDGGICIKN